MLEWIGIDRSVAWWVLIISEVMMGAA